jgi:hypothetical protein
MTAKDKAKQLVNKFYSKTDSEGVIFCVNWSSAKECALIAVDEVLNVLPQHEYLEDRDEYCENRERLYWQEVKQEIQKL